MTELIAVHRWFRGEAFEAAGVGRKETDGRVKEEKMNLERPCLIQLQGHSLLALRLNRATETLRKQENERPC
jgi:hypothetical protein